MIKDCSNCFYREFDRTSTPCGTCSEHANFVPFNMYMTVSATQEDVVNKPHHYTRGKIEPIDAIEDWNLNFRLANVVKYVARAEHKGKPLEDLKKALWYLQREIDKRESNL